MNAGSRLTIYGVGLVIAFVSAFGLTNIIIPDDASVAWTERNEPLEDHSSHETQNTNSSTTEPHLSGLSLSANGLMLSNVEAPKAVGEPGELRFRIESTHDGSSIEYTTTHEKGMHLIVVRSDGSDFRHVHPKLDKSTGTWAVPWSWIEAGTFRLYADFAPTGASAVTLTSTVQVAGDFVPVEPVPVRTSEAGGFAVKLDGDLTIGASNKLTLTVEESGKAVTVLQPYLGAFGHLVALRQGDLAFLHVHPEGETPEADDTGGPRFSSWPKRLPPVFINFSLTFKLMEKCTPPCS
ncbi:heavy-metal-associated domain-containing protein [Leucobacter coleopterorum]|uniref:heavy-metal-associated domain-containing protein n=1 Tax=Leucobacter coleopterorum TaxID=2714933 RepID=UPI001FCC9342|nr:heavy-metal-associated domain-containing protein [Leucobacter coleopterorum]